MNRHSTSACQVRDLRHPDRHTPMKVLVYDFVERLWAAYLASNISDLRYTIVCVISLGVNISSVFRPVMEMGRDEDEELQQDGAVLDTGDSDSDGDNDVGDEEMEV